MIIPGEKTKWLLELLSSCNIACKEFDHRKKRLEAAQQMPESEISRFNDQYYNLTHEIKSLYFLQQFGTVIMAEDYRNKAGCDCILKNYYQIECVCSSAGENTDRVDLFGKKRDLKFCVGNYDKTFLFCRLTSSIKKKLDFYNDHVKNGTIDTSLPYIIFLGLGALSYEIFSGDKGIEFTSILFGRGDLTLSIDKETGSMTPNGYTHIDELFNHNHSPVNFNVFREENYRRVSGIIISAAKLDEEYTADNTWLFTNPNAHIKIDTKDFPNTVYWDLYTDTEYGPYRDGRRLVN